MKVGDVVKIIDADGFVWPNLVDLSKVKVIVKEIFPGMGLVRVKLEKDGGKFRPNGNMCDIWDFHEKALEVVK